MSPIFVYTCNKCGVKIERLFLTFKEAEKKKNALFVCPGCNELTERDETQLPSKFMGVFGSESSAPSKRHSYKKINKNKDNAG